MKKLFTLFAVIFSFSLSAQWNYDVNSCVDPYDVCSRATPDGTTYFPSWRFQDTTAFHIYTHDVMIERCRAGYNDGAPSSIVWSTSTGALRRTAITGTATDGYSIVYDGTTGKLKYAMVSASSLPSQTGNAGKYLTTNGTTASWSNLPGADRFTAYSAGTNYTLNTTSQKVDFSTTDPTVTITAPGTYVIYANVKIEYAGLTTALNALNFKLRRTNNTAADLSNASTTFNVPAVTLLTGTGGDCDIPMVIYTTTNSNDVIEMWGNRSGGLTLGSIQVGEASIVAVRIQ